MKKRLITAALPYVNNVPHLGNLIQVLSADVYARYCRKRTYPTLYICGTDEYGTATETKALELGLSPQELCDHYYEIHRHIYDYFNISFDHFGRSSSPWQKQSTQEIFLALYENGYILEKTIEQFYCFHCQRFLADRFIQGSCPHCNYSSARGDQCESCSKVLDPQDLQDPRCSLCQTKPKLKETKHLYFKVSKLSEKLQQWTQNAQEEHRWSSNALGFNKSWLKEGLQDRSITRDLSWGVPVPLEGFENKVFYVWFDAPIGYISMTREHTSSWKDWWLSSPETELIQFIGKDNIPFHSLFFPAALMATGQEWTLMHRLASSEYLTYEGGKFSKSAGLGIFGDDVEKLGLPVDMWRFYLILNRPEKADSRFSWNDFQERINSELIGNIANLFQRVTQFYQRFFGEKIAQDPLDPDFIAKLEEAYSDILKAFEETELRRALLRVLELAAWGNKSFQEKEPWKSVKTQPQESRIFLRQMLELLKYLALFLSVFIPQSARRMCQVLGIQEDSWDQRKQTLSKLNPGEALFTRIENHQKDEWSRHFNGQQNPSSQEQAMSQEVLQNDYKELFRTKVRIRIARILDVKKHPEAEKLYILRLDDSSHPDRQIVSGLAQHYEAKELQNRLVFLADNLKKARFRGIDSFGMLLAVNQENNDDDFEVLFAPDDALVGSFLVLPEDQETPIEALETSIKIETFLKLPLRVKESVVVLEDDKLVIEKDGRHVYSQRITDGPIS